MLRLVRIILLGMFIMGIHPLFSQLSLSSLLVPQAHALDCTWVIFCLNDDTKIHICNSDDPKSSQYCSIDK